MKGGDCNAVLSCPALLQLPSIPQPQPGYPCALSYGEHDIEYALHTGSPAGGENAGLATVLAAAAGPHSQRRPLKLDMLLTSKRWQWAVPGLQPEDTADTHADVNRSGSQGKKKEEIHVGDFLMARVAMCVSPH